MYRYLFEVATEGPLDSDEITAIHDSIKMNAVQVDYISVQVDSRKEEKEPEYVSPPQARGFAPPAYAQSKTGKNTGRESFSGKKDPRQKR